VPRTSTVCHHPLLRIVLTTEMTMASTAPTPAYSAMLQNTRMSPAIAISRSVGYGGPCELPSPITHMTMFIGLSNNKTPAVVGLKSM